MFTLTEPYSFLMSMVEGVFFNWRSIGLLLFVIRMDCAVRSRIIREEDSVLEFQSPWIPSAVTRLLLVERSTDPLIFFNSIFE